jgi:hypothetical protein
MNRQLFLSRLASLGIALLIGACASTPHFGEGKTKSDALLKTQFQTAESAASNRSAPRLIFAGFAMHSQSKAFRSDVLTAEKMVLSVDPEAIVFKLDNPVAGQETSWPYATADNVAAVLKKVGGLARPQDKVVILISTHGNVDALAINFSSQNYPYINAAVLNEYLADLKDKPLLLMLSACHSGSFIGPLNAPNRIILTAAAKDRSSFGCQFQSTNTYFIDALLGQTALGDRSVLQLMDQAKVEIDRRERARKLSPPSLPQAFVGMTASEWANQPIKNWLVTSQKSTQ